METIHSIYIVFAGVLGLAIGSFLNVLILRTRAGQVITGRSECVHCKHQLAWYDLIPLVSFIWLRAKCRYCGKPLNWQYPGVELLTGLVFAAIVWHFFPQLDYIATYLVASALLICVIVYDAKYMQIPDRFTLPLAIVGVLGSWWLGLSWLSIGLGIVIGGGFFALQYVVSRGRWIGDGDIYLGAAMGAVLGFPVIIAALFVAYIGGSIVAVYMLLTGGKQRGDALPFGVFLAAATILCFFYGQNMIDWYWYEMLGI